MFGEFLDIIVRSIKLDKSLYKDNKNFNEAAIYFAGLIIMEAGQQLYAEQPITNTKKKRSVIIIPN